jgi:hypothetical protein
MGRAFALVYFMLLVLVFIYGVVPMALYLAERALGLRRPGHDSGHQSVLQPRIEQLPGAHPVDE